MDDEDVKCVQFYICDCFITDNIFLQKYKLHVRFVSEQQFRLDYELVSNYCIRQKNVIVLFYFYRFSF